MRKNLLTKSSLIAKELQYDIEQGSLLHMEKLPSERELSDTFKVQRGTIREALDLLVQERLIFSKPKVGYFVNEKRVRKFTNPLALNDPSKRDNLVRERISFEKIYADSWLSNQMLVPKSSEVYRIVIICYDDKVVVGKERYYLLSDTTGTITEKDMNTFSVAELATKGIIKTASSNIKSNQKITLAYTNSSDSSLFGIEENTPLLRHRGLEYNEKGQLVLFYDNFLLPHYFEFYRMEQTYHDK